MNGGVRRLREERRVEPDVIGRIVLRAAGLCASASRCASVSLALLAASGAAFGNGSGNPECDMKTPLNVQPPMIPFTQRFMPRRMALAERQVVRADHRKLLRHIVLRQPFFQRRYPSGHVDIRVLRVQRRDLLERLAHRVGDGHGQAVREAPRQLQLRGVVALAADRHVRHLRAALYCGNAKSNCWRATVAPFKPEFGSRPAIGFGTCWLKYARRWSTGIEVQRVERNEVQRQA